jgi:hypothetical protein
MAKKKKVQVLTPKKPRCKCGGEDFLVPYTERVEVEKR